MARSPKKKPSKSAGSSVRQRILDFLLKNVGKVVTGDDIKEAARDPKTRKRYENWHQRLSELRTDFGYNIQTNRDTQELGVSEYRLVSATPGPVAGKRVKIAPATWAKVLARAGQTCEWEDGGIRCGLKAGEKDPVGGGTVKLTPDHQTPHSVNPNIDPDNPDEWQALCGRHQVMKKNFWDHRTRKLNVYAIVQAAPEQDKRAVYEFLKSYFGD